MRTRRLTDFPFAELTGDDPSHVAWVKKQRDPELWHVFATALVVTGDAHGFLPWVFDQPETDRATAGYVFLGLFGNDYLQGRTKFGGEGLSDAEWLAAMEAICRRGASAGFSNNALGLADGFEPERLACLETVNLGRVAESVPIPHSVIDTRFPDERSLPYFVEAGVVLTYDPTA